MTFTKTFTAVAIGLAGLMPVHAQEAEFQAPAQCTTSPAMGGMDHSSMDDGGMSAAGMEMMGSDAMQLQAMPEHVQENMRRMTITMPAMHEGMMQDDPDVAFACGMIAHHQGAIDMAEVLLEHGEDEQMRALAEEIMGAQTAEIEQMTMWLEENAN